MRPKIASILHLALVLLALVFAAPASAQADGATRLRAAIAGPWEYRWGPSPRSASGGPVWQDEPSSSDHWATVQGLREPPGRKAQGELWMRVRLPAVAWGRQALFIHEIDHVLDVYADAKPLYHYGEARDGVVLKAPGWRWHMIPLPEEAAGKTLVLHAVSDDVLYIGPYGYVGVSSPYAHVERMVRRDADRGAVAILSVFIGVLTLIVYAGKRPRAEYLYFALFAIACGLYVACRMELKTFLWDAPWFWMRLELGSLSWMPVLFAWHVRDLLHPRFHRLLSRVAAAGAALAVAGLALGLVNLVPSYNWLPVILVELFFIASFVGVAAVRSVRMGLPEARLISVGLVVAGVITILSTLSSARILGWSSHSAHWAILVLVVFMGSILIRRFIVTYYEVERTLKEREARLTAVINALPDSLLLTARDGRILESRIRPQDADLLIRPPTETDTVSETLVEEVARPLMVGSHHDEPIHVFETTAPAGASQSLFEVRTVPVGDEQRLSVVRNVTDRKKLERMSREFVAMVSHELRTPITAIKGCLDLLYTAATSGHAIDRERLLRMAKENSDRLVALINDLLDSQKIESGHFMVYPRSTEVVDLVRVAVELNRPFGFRSRVEVAVIEPVPELKIQADFDRVMQALTNLITNAVKYSEEGGVVTVAAEVRPECVRFSVRDRGAGVPVAFRDRLFHKFAQADSSSTRLKGGTGLGLSISKAIVEQHGGRIGHEDVPEGGSHFYIDLPR